MLVALFSWWQLEIQVPRQAPAQLGVRSPDRYAEQLTVTRFDNQGRPRQRLRAARMRHYDQDDTTELEQPRFWRFSPQHLPWRVEGRQALLYGSSEQIFLPGPVTLDRSGDQTHDSYHITTSDLTLDSRKDYAETSRKIRIDSSDHWIDAIGMQGWLHSPVRIKLLHDVHGQYTTP